MVIREEKKKELMRQMAEERKAELAKMPMNAYLGKESELAKKIGKFMLSDYEAVTDVMRKIKIFYVMLRDSKQHILQIKTAMKAFAGTAALLDMQTFGMLDEKGKEMTAGKARVKILEEEARIQGCLTDIRNKVTQDLLKLISNNEFTDKAFEQYVAHIEKVLEVEGHILFPEEYKILPLC